MGIQQLNTEKNNRIIFLDYLRIFAFSSVIIGHHFYDQALVYTHESTTHISIQFIIGMLLPLFYCGGAGVVVFFFVSGYVITHVLQTENTLDFIVKRLFRIYPLYMAAVLIQNTNSIIKCILIPGLISERLPTLLSQLFLVGDFFGTGYSLYGIEWTLRVEILFYFYMAILHKLNVLHAHKKYFSSILAASAALLMLLPPFPTWNEVNMATVTLYFPFLLLGASIYLAEKKQTSYIFTAVFSVLVFFEFITQIKILQPRWADTYFSQIAFMIFIAAWALRNKLAMTRFVLFSSNLTYAAYLFHSWHYDAIKKILIRNAIEFMNVDVLTLIILFIVCIVAIKFIEKPGIRLGNIVLKKINR